MSTDCDVDAVAAAYDAASGFSWGASVGEGRCHAIGGDLASMVLFVDMGLTLAEQKLCASRAINILPELNKANCDISPP